MKPAVEWMRRPSRPSDRLPLEAGDEVVGQPDALERRAEHELAGVEDERVLVVDLDELGQLRLLDLDVDERVAVVVEDAEEPVDADVDARRLQERRVVRVDLDPPLGEQAGDRRVGEDHRGDSMTAESSSRRVTGYRGPVAVTRAIELQTEIPGPRSREIIERKERVVADPLGLYLPIVIEEGRGATVTDVDGNTFVDFTGGVGCLNVGHAHPRVVAAVQEQAARFFHTDFTIVPYEIYVEYAERLTALAPFSGPAKAAFFNAGTEAVENAVKFARGYTKRPAVIAFEGGVPRPHAPLALAHLEDAPVQGRARAVRARGLPRPVPERVPRDHRADALDALERAFSTQVAAETVAAIVVEPVQGEGGFIVAPPEFMRGAARDLRPRGDPARRRRGADRLRAHRAACSPIEHYGVEPDLITVAKSIAGGPAALRRRRQGRDHGLALATTRSAARTSATPSRSPRRSPSSTCSRRRGSSSARSGSARRSGRGCSPGRSASTRSATSAGSARCSRSSSSRTARRRSRRPSIASRVAEEAAVRGLLLLKAGIHSNCNRVLCPLVITDAELDEGLAAWEEALEAVLA